MLNAEDLGHYGNEQRSNFSIQFKTFIATLRRNSNFFFILSRRFKNVCNLPNQLWFLTWTGTVERPLDNSALCWSVVSDNLVLWPINKPNWFYFCSLRHSIHYFSELITKEVLILAAYDTLCFWFSHYSAYGLTNSKLISLWRFHANHGNISNAIDCASIRTILSFSTKS